LNTEELLLKLDRPPSQLWLDAVCLQLLQNKLPEKNIGEIISAIKSARGSKKRLDAFVKIVKAHPNDLTTILSILGLIHRDELRALVDDWLPRGDDNIAQFIARSRSQLRSFLITEDDTQQSLIWLQKNSRHADAAEVIRGVLFHANTDENISLTANWVAKNIQEFSAASVLSSLLSTKPSESIIHLARRYVELNLKNAWAQDLLRQLLSISRTGEEDLIKDWRELPLAKRDGAVLAELISLDPSAGLYELARKMIEQGSPGDHILISQLIESRPPELSGWLRDWLPSKASDGFYVPLIIQLARSWNDWQILEEVPLTIWKTWGMLLRRVIYVKPDPVYCDLAKLHINENPDSMESFMFMRCMIGSEPSMLMSIKDWIESSCDNSQVISGLQSILRSNPSEEWASSRLREWIENQCALGWGSSYEQVYKRIYSDYSPPL